MPLALRSQRDERNRSMVKTGWSWWVLCLPPGRLLRLVVKDRQRYSNPQKMKPLMAFKRTVSTYQCDGKKGVNLPLEVAVRWMKPRYVGFDLVEPSGPWKRPRRPLYLSLRPTNARIWHKAVFKVGPVAGPKPTRVRQGQKYIRPRRHSPFWGASGARQ